MAINSNGAPIPRPRANSFSPPPTASPLALMYSSAPASGAETQPAIRSRRELIACGRRSSNAPNMAMAKITKNPENGTRTQADCNRAWRFKPAPNTPISAPSSAKQAAIGSTYARDSLRPRKPPTWPRRTTPDRIGSIGNTHGVKVRPTPARKNSASSFQLQVAAVAGADRLAVGLAATSPMLKPLSAQLIGDDQGEGALLSGLAWQVDIENAVIDLDVAEVLVMLLFALGQLRFAQADICGLGAELEAMPIQIIAFGSDQAQLDRLRRGVDQAQLKRLTNGQKIFAVIQRGAAQRRCGAAVQQARSGNGQGQDQ